MYLYLAVLGSLACQFVSADIHRAEKILILQMLSSNPPEIGQEVAGGFLTALSNACGGLSPRWTCKMTYSERIEFITSVVGAVRCIPRSGSWDDPLVHHAWVELLGISEPLEAVTGLYFLSDTRVCLDRAMYRLFLSREAQWLEDSSFRVI
jgi:hypothetical protein